MTALVLEIDGLELRFGGVTALGGVTFAVAGGECVALLGPNGAGKTSVLNCVSGAVRPTAGRIRLGGRYLDGVPAAQRAGLGVARTFQSPAVVEALDVGGNLLLGRHSRLRAGLVAGALAFPTARREEADARRRAAAIAQALGLDPGAAAAGLPAGARKRLELARALAGDPALLLLDEPFAGTSAGEQEVMAAAIRATVEGGAAAVVVDHHLDAVLALATRRVELDRGRMATTGAAP